MQCHLFQFDFGGKLSQNVTGKIHDYFRQNVPGKIHDYFRQNVQGKIHDYFSH